MLARLDACEVFAGYVATLGRGPGRSRALTRDEARAAFDMVLAGVVDPHQVGAFLMLLRYRGEDAGEIAGIVEAMQGACVAAPPAALDWPSYGAGRTRDLPWFLLAALALGQSGTRVFMHGSNEFGTALATGDALTLLGRTPARDMDAAAGGLEREGFCYAPIGVLAPGVETLLGLRRLFGLRSPVNTAVRLLDPTRAASGVDGVFHPAYLDVHMGVAALLGRPRLLVLKGGGGEAERVPAKAGVAHLWNALAGRSVLELAGETLAAGGAATPALFTAVWRGEAQDGRALATVRATLALALAALGRGGDLDGEARAIWAARRL